MTNKLTLKKLKAMKPNTVIAKGIVSDNSAGINMTNSDKLLRWIAVRGGTYDWAIYCHWATSDWGYVQSNGDKVNSEDNIKTLVPCTDKAFGMYRH